MILHNEHDHVFQHPPLIPKQHNTQISPFLYVGMYSSIFFFRRDAIVMSVRATIEKHTTTYMDCKQADTCAIMTQTDKPCTIN